jgi:hypothetical protein
VTGTSTGSFTLKPSASTLSIAKGAQPLPAEAGRLYCD